MDQVKIKHALEELEKHLDRMDQAIDRLDFRKVGGEMFHTRKQLEILKSLLGEKEQKKTND